MPKPPKVPQGPDYNQLTQQQTTANIDAAAASQRGSLIDQSNPFSSVKYTQTGTGPGGIPTYGADIQYTPEQQALLDQLNQTKGYAGSYASGLLGGTDYSQAPDLSTGVNSRVTQRLGQAAEFFTPVYDTQSENLDAQLRNQGLLPGMKGYDRAIRELRDTQNRSTGAFISEFQPQAFSQSLQEYQLPAQMSAILSALGAPEDIAKGQIAPNQFPGANIQPANVIGAGLGSHQNKLAAYDRQKSQYDQMISGLMGLGTTALTGGLGGLGGVAGIIGNSVANQFRPAGGDWITSMMSA